MKKEMRKDNIWSEERGQTGAEILAGISAVLGALLNFMSHPLTRFITIESLFLADSAVAFFINWQGAFGASIGFLLSQFTGGIPIPIETWQLVIAYPCIEAVIWMISNGRQ